MSGDVGREELRRLAGKATPGPWQGPEWDEGPNVWAEHPATVIVGMWHTSGRNAAYIAAASPDVILGLLDDLRAAEARVEVLERNLHGLELNYGVRAHFSPEPRVRWSDVRDDLQEARTGSRR